MKSVAPGTIPVHNRRNLTENTICLLAALHGTSSLVPRLHSTGWVWQPNYGGGAKTI